MRQLNRLATGERIGPDPDTYNAFNVGAQGAGTGAYVTEVLTTVPG
jgi:hypothetical protein